MTRKQNCNHPLSLVVFQKEGLSLEDIQSQLYGSQGLARNNGMPTNATNKLIQKLQKKLKEKNCK